ncbi:MAG: UDP-3-O-(3-hydroxymyristoyl)glucosamine N-acyltransferase [Bacteroidetes bacterium HGW-Bacteroidetes-20]|nr:MAG: UDP-3-O-(3-hydroxymyristoyl)glucosamine N-acyltransferase [Bacteroidetes bacterium HGW-Bacteroidetes-20]
MKFANPITIEQVLKIITQKVDLQGSNTNLVKGINEIHSVEEGDLSFVDNDKYYERVLKSAATIILIDKNVECPEGKTLLICEDPLLAYLDIVNYFVKFVPQNQPIHPNAKIGEGTIIQPNVFIGDNVSIGKNCIIHSNVSIYSDTVIGNNVVIHSNSTISADACYFQKRAEKWIKIDSCGSTIIEDDVEVGCNCCIDKGVSGVTFIGEGTKFDNLIQIGHDTHIGKRCLIGAQVGIAGCTFIDDDCSIWAKSGINKDLYIAKNTTVLAFSGVDKSINESGLTLFGVPADDARKKWKELAYVKMLPEIADAIKNFRNSSK